MLFFTRKQTLPEPGKALPGRDEPMKVSNRHFVSGNLILPPFPERLREAIFALGCFWGAERKFWQYPHIFSTAAGYTGGFTKNPTYDEVCTGLTGHAEAVKVVYDPALTSYEDLLKLFWEAHNPTQGMRQGNDVGTQYRSGIYALTGAQKELAEASREHYRKRLSQAGLPAITTEILPAGEFYYAEDYHQQYLAKNPGGYCGLGGTGVCF